jgi:hypothetical protein
MISSHSLFFGLGGIPRVRFGPQTIYQTFETSRKNVQKTNRQQNERRQSEHRDDCEYDGVIVKQFT